MKTFIDLFAGIGGFHQALTKLGQTCVFACEINPFARQTYCANYPLADKLEKAGKFPLDIKQVDKMSIPDFDLLCAGFPCQPFSQAGLKKGFEDTRGTLFFDIARIIKYKQPSAFFLENVRNLEKHDNGKTLATIKRVLTEELGYSLHYQVLHASDYGVPQHRPRLYLVGFKNKAIPFKFPEKIPLTLTMSHILGGDCPRKIGFTLRVGGKRSPIDGKHNWDGYWVNGKEHRLTLAEATQMQGFPSSFQFPVSNSQAMKQLGNSVAVPVIQAIGTEILKAIHAFAP